MALMTQGEFARRKRLRVMKGRIFYGLCLLAVLISLGMLGVLLFKIGLDGYARLSWDFIVKDIGIDWNWPFFAHRLGGPLQEAGGGGFRRGVGWQRLRGGHRGHYFLCAGSGGGRLPGGIRPAQRVFQAIRINIANLAGVPSIVYGLLGLEIFVRMMELGRSVLAGGFTLALLVLPLIIVASSEAIRAVPSSLREGGFGLGATRWQVVRHLVLPQAMPGILTGVILAVSRAIGETAPLIVMGALTFVPFTPGGPLDKFTVMPIQIFNWISPPSEGIPRGGGGGHHRPAGGAAGDERPGGLPTQQVPKPTGRVETCRKPPKPSSGPTT